MRFSACVVVIGLAVGVGTGPAAYGQTNARLVLDHFEVVLQTQCSGNVSATFVETKSTQPPGKVTGTKVCTDAIQTVVSATAAAELSIVLPDTIPGSFVELNGTGSGVGNFTPTASVVTVATLKAVLTVPRAEGVIAGVGDGKSTCAGSYISDFNSPFTGVRNVTLTDNCSRNVRNIFRTGPGVSGTFIHFIASAQPYVTRALTGNSALSPPNVTIQVDAYYELVVGPAVDLAIDHIQITQPVQVPSMEAKVVIGKPSIVRVFVKSASGASINNVTGTATANGIPLTPVPRGSGDPFLFADTIVQASYRGNSLDFYLPAALATASVTADATVSYSLASGGPGPDNNPANNRQNRTFFMSPTTWPNPLKIGIVSVCINKFCPNFAHGAKAIRLAAQELLPAVSVRVFPVLMPRLRFDTLKLGDPSETAAAALIMVKEYFAAQEFNAPLGLTGEQLQLLPHIVAFLQPEEVSKPEFIFPIGVSPFVWVGDYAREVLSTGFVHALGHNVGLQESKDAAPEGAAWYASTNSADLILYPIMAAYSDSWITPEESNLFLSLGLKDEPAAVIRAAATGDTLLISGSIADDGSSGTLSPGFHAPSNAVTTPSNSSSNTCLRFTAPGGNQDYCFTPLPIKANGKTFFAINAPYPAGTTRVELVKGGRTLAFFNSAAPPQVSILTPLAGEVWQGVRKVRWSATGAGLQFTVQYSPDAGMSWQQLAGGLTATEYEFDTSEIMGGTKVQFRVVASSGIDNASATSATISIPQTLQLAVPVTTLDFSNLRLNDAQTREFTITNSGTGQMMVTLTPPANAAFKLVTNGTFLLRPGEGMDVIVSFAPTTAGAQTSTLKVNETSVTLRGSAFANPTPDLSVPSSFDLGDAEIGRTKDRSLTLLNDGGAALTISSATVTTGFSIVTTLPMTIEAGRIAALTLRLAAATAGARTGQLTLVSDDMVHTPKTVALTARGVTGPVPVSSAAGVLNAASFKGGAVAPGEILTLFGTSVGPPVLANLKLDDPDHVSKLTGDTRVLFDGIPGAIIYSLAGQTSVIVPYAVAGKPTTDMVVEYQGRRSDPVTLQVGRAAPGLFSANSSGTGPGAILNQNYVLITATNPAPVGSAIILFGTGEGLVLPTPADGGVNNAVFPQPTVGVTATIGGKPAKVLYAGAAPNLVAGVLQVNLEVPAGLSTGNQPVVVTIGNAPSQAGLTVAVKAAPTN